MVFIHGGFFESGTGVFPLFHGDSFVRIGGVILVTLNYRIGALGSLFTDREGIRGNFGIQDQRLAMEWVYRNIRRFGGNNRLVTIFGRSAGASYVGMHLVNRKADRFFRRAIMMSAGLGIARKTTDQALSVGRSFSEKLNCDPRDTVCLRSRSVEEVLTAQSSTSRDSLSMLQRYVTWEPFPDNNEIFIDLQFGLRNGLIGNNKRVIIGVTAHENKQYVLDFYQEPVPLALYQVLVNRTLPDQAEGVLQRYAPADPTDARPELTYFFDDIIFTCPACRVAIDLSKYRPGYVFFYVFDNGLTFLRGTNIKVPCQKHACHGNENGFLFQTITKLGFQLSRAEKRLGYQLTTSWTKFAKSGNPSFPRSLGESFWPPYLLSNNERYSLIYRHFMAPRTTNEQDFRGEMCYEFDQNGFYA